MAIPPGYVFDCGINDSSTHPLTKVHSFHFGGLSGAFYLQKTSSTGSEYENAYNAGDMGHGDACDARFARTQDRSGVPELDSGEIYETPDLEIKGP